MSPGRPRPAGAPRGERLQKVLASAGFRSRREVERLIAEGRITVDNRRAELGARVTVSQTIRVDGRVVPRRRRRTVPKLILYHKPEGAISSRRDSEGRRTVYDDLPRLKGERWIAVGRLDINSSGLLLFTTDGELAHRLMHPSSRVEREYAVRVRGPITHDMIERLRAGVRIDGEMARFTQITEGRGSGVNRWYRVVLREGRNREVRKLWAAVGATVSRLIRIRYGPVILPRGLRPGRQAALKPQQIVDLYAAAGLPPQKA